METKFKHGIAIREKKTKKLVKFIECPTGQTALRVLAGARHNLGDDYKAEEDYVHIKNIEELRKESK